ncbi:MAG: hypothetical protein H7061_08915 [Bdellovibrionaceae bacterium]|nr:hypothetical protein [Bdellovibrio sp.]
MKKVLFTIMIFSSAVSMASLSAESIYKSLKVPEQELTKIKCSKSFGQLTCVKINDALQTGTQYYCTIKLTKTDSIRI